MVVQGGNRRQPAGSRLNWLLDDLVGRLTSVRMALVLSSDGLPMSVSEDVSREDSEHLAAVASGIHGLAKGVGTHFEAGSVRQTLVELDDAFLFVTAAGDGSCLAVMAASDADIGQIAYEMTLLVKRVGAAGQPVLTSDGRAAAPWRQPAAASRSFSSSCQPKLRSTALRQLRYSRSRVPSSIRGVHWVSRFQWDLSSSWSCHTPVARPAA
jgi:predicted regulator of Ras-like GTPase activity (Roadblock/LC7/MglB family)